MNIVQKYAKPRSTAFGKRSSLYIEDRAKSRILLEYGKMAVLRSALLASGSLLASMVMPVAVQAQSAETQPVAPANGEPASAPAPAAANQPSGDIVVTGSRVITNGNAAPTPVTVLSTEKLLETAPSSVADALQRLPQFASNPGARNIDNATSNSTGNYLNLRQFGAQRTLILLDGARMPPTASNGTVDVNTIPQALIKRVDVVTGGASAVYGSDAITGVVNFVLDRKFDGFRFNSQYGTSTYGDDQSWRIGAVAGTKVLDGRGHIEVSFDHYNSDGLGPMDAREGGRYQYITGGDGSASNPYRLVKNGRILYAANGGMIIGSSLPGALPDGLRDIVFKTDGVASPLVHGISSGSSGSESGGDGGQWYGGAIAASLKTDQAFGRFDYDVSDDVHAYVQGSFNQSSGGFIYQPLFWLGSSVASGNPFIPQSVQNAMTANNVDYITLGRINTPGTGYPENWVRQRTTNILAKTGLEGKLGRFSWNANYSFGRSQLYSRVPYNMSAAKVAAALDAVVDPASGRIVCAVSLTPYANRYQGCQPLNLFGPTAPSAGAIDWVTDETHYRLTNIMHDVNIGISGALFSLPAGEVRGSLSGEYRRMSLRNVSNADPGTPPDCTGLNVVGNNCTSTTSPYITDITASMHAKQDVKEIAGELAIPVLADVPLIRRLDLNLAARYTNYSTSGSATTWKVGGTWEVFHGLSFRGVASRDIRAPTLQDLFQPYSAHPSGFYDLHTNITGSIPSVSQGNENLKPEVARTNSFGVIYTPDWAPGLSIAADYYEITIKNAITTRSGSDIEVQSECERTGGTSPYCALIVRPHGFSDTSAGNFPIYFLNQSINAAKTWTRGIDAEINYRFDLERISGNLPGTLSLRSLVAYQPQLRTQPTATSAVSEQAGVVGLSKVRVNFNLLYDLGGFNLALTERWMSKAQPSDRRLYADLRPDVPAYSYTDISVRYTTEIGGHKFTPFLTVENLFNKQPPIIGSVSAGPGLFFPTGNGYDVIGRYFTMGVKGEF